MENNTEPILEEILKVKKTLGRPRLVPGEYAPSKPKDKEYFRQYYHKSKVSDVINCELCSRTVTRRQLLAHQKSLRCIPIYKLVLEELESDVV